MAEESPCHYRLGSGLAVCPTGRGSAVTFIAGMIERGHVGGKQGNVHHPANSSNLPCCDHCRGCSVRQGDVKFWAGPEHATGVRCCWGPEHAPRYCDGRRRVLHVMKVGGGDDLPEVCGNGD